ncbi:MAG TPA: hypothetical protein VJL34_14455 [Anaerolineales bacterium]|nr:hypothetical protein [Anaerolineales bacterium]
MKQHTILIGLLLLAFVFSACGGAQVSGTTGQASSLLNANDENALGVELQLAIGTLKLDDTEDAIDAEMAAELLPLWKAVRSLNQSDSVAAEELQALFKQIQETMTTAQVQAIAEMQLTAADMAQIAEELGLEFFAGGRFGELSPELQATAQAARESGQFPQGGFSSGGVPGAGPGGGPGGGEFPGGQLSPEQQATLEARRAEGGGARLGLSPAVLNAVIAYLEAKVQ